MRVRGLPANLELAFRDNLLPCSRRTYERLLSFKCSLAMLLQSAIDMFGYPASIERLTQKCNRTVC